MKPLNIVRVVQTLFFLNAAIWLMLCALSLVRIADVNSENQTVFWVILIFMLGNIGAMIIVGIGLGKQQKRFYHFAIAILGINIVLSITDEFGIYDLVILLLNLMLLGLLFATRKKYIANQMGR